MPQGKDIASLHRDKADRAIGDRHKWFRLLGHGVDLDVGAVLVFR